MHPDRVSIVIPCYNDDPEHLVASVASTSNQSHPDVEVIVVDDGSTRPETLEAMAGLGEVTLLRRQNGGTGSALNTGIRASTGEFILPLGADDLIPENFVGSLLDALRSAPSDVVGVYPGVEFFGDGSGIADAPMSVELSDIVVRNRVVASSLYRRRDWELVGGYGEFNDCSEDWYFWAVLLGRTGGRLIQESKVRLYYRIRPGSRNSVNRSLERKQNARRHIAEALPEQLPQLFLAAAEEADNAMADAQRYGAFVEEWRQRLRLVRPAYKFVHRFLPSAR